MELKRNKVKQILKAVVGRARYKDIEEIKNTIKSFLRIELINLDFVNVELHDKDFTETDFIDSEIDYFIVGTIEDTENNETYDFDLFYTKTRTNGIYIIEFIMQ